MSSEVQKTQVAVIGAGPAGMAAAHTLNSRGIDVVVLEREDQVGGLTRTLAKGDFRFDLGSHRFFTKKQKVAAFVEELLPGELITVKRTSRILFQDRYFDYPPSAWNAFAGLGPVMSAKIGLTYLAERLKDRSTPPATLEEWMTRQFGRVMYEIFFKTYTEKVWGVPCKDMAAIWASQRIKGMSLAAAIRQAVLPSGDPPASMIDNFRYPRKGIGRICEKMSEDLGSRVMLGARVEKITRRGSGWTVEATGAEGAISIEAEQVIATMPVTELIRAFSPAPPAEVRAAAESLEFRDLILVAVMFDRPPITKDSWIYIPDPSICFGRFHEPTNFSVEMSPAGKTSLVFDLFCFHSDPVWNLPDDKILDRVLSDFSSIKIMEGDVRAKVLDYQVVRAPKAYPLQRLGYGRPLGVIKRCLDGLPGLGSVGREGLFEYLNIDHALESGMLAAENVMGAGHDIRASIMDSTYLETGAVTGTGEK